jgi:hypothetical protein
MSDSSDAGIGDIARLDISSPSSSSSIAKSDIARTGLLNLPDEILNVIGGILLNGNFSSEGYQRHCKVK